MNKESLNKCLYGSRRTADSLSPENGLHLFSETSDSRLLQPIEPQDQREATWAPSLKSPAEHAACSQYRRQSLEKLFLDLESVRLSKEDEDSASDLSDSERVPIPPSPLTPPKLNLRAEEIRPGYFSPYAEHKGKDHEYPDFLPPPYNSWNLRQVSMFVHKEGKDALRSTASEPLERYVDRLLQLEWFQMQTVEAEKAKVGKSRPQTVPATYRNGKSPGKCKPLLSPLPSKYLSHLENGGKASTGQEKSHHKKHTHRELCGAAQKTCTKVSGTVQTPPSGPKPTQDVRSKKKSVTNYQQTRDVLFSEAKMQSAGNIRPQRQMFVSSTAENIAKQTKVGKVRKSELSVSSHVTNRHGLSERKK